MVQKDAPCDSLQSARKNQVLNLKIDKVTVILRLHSPLVATLPCTSIHIFLHMDTFVQLKLRFINTSDIHYLQ